MKPQDIDKIANLVVGSLAAAPGVGILGCGAISSAQDYDPVNDCTANNPFECVVAYDCGHAGLFACQNGFTCSPTTGNLFRCDDGQGFFCGSRVVFSCVPQEAFWPTAVFPTPTT